jgi:four helix bundle protein
MKTWNAYKFATDLVAAVVPLAAQVARHDKSLASQLRRAVASVPLNLAEGSGRSGADRLHHYRIALGSAREVRAALEVAGLFGWADVAAADRIADTACALIYGHLR